MVYHRHSKSQLGFQGQTTPYDIVDDAGEQQALLMLMWTLLLRSVRRVSSYRFDLLTMTRLRPNRSERFLSSFLKPLPKSSSQARGVSFLIERTRRRSCSATFVSMFDLERMAKDLGFTWGCLIENDSNRRASGQVAIKSANKGFNRQ